MLGIVDDTEEKSQKDQVVTASKPSKHFERPHQPFLGPLAAILDFAGGSALQAVNECHQRR